MMPTPFVTFFADVSYMWGPVQFAINDDTQEFGFSHFYNFISINRYIFYGPRHTFWCKSMTFVLSMFRENLLALTHAYILAISLLISETISFRLYLIANRFVS